ncbi:2-oxoglutarate-dependent dioxygenase DAO [Linum perenne]
MATIPIIDLNHSSSPENQQLLREACEKWGCFRVANHGVDPALMLQMKKVVRELLDLPMEIKRRNKDVIPGSGYVAPSPKNPLYDALGLYDMGSTRAVEEFCDQLDASPHQRETILEYAKEIHGVAMELAARMAESFGVGGGGVDSFRGWPCQFRINKYNFQPETIGSPGVQIHTDSGFLTVLQEDESVGGLEVMDPSGDRYIPVDPVPGSLLLNLGDLATVWSNGRLRNVKHRVQCKEATVRISIATFLLGPPRNVAVELPEAFVDGEHPRMYRPISYDELRLLRQSTNLHAGDVLELLRDPPPSQSSG